MEMEDETKENRFYYIEEQSILSQEEGSFIKGDQVKKITSLKGIDTNDCNDIVFKVEWNDRENGQQLLDTYICYKLLKQQQPYLVFQYFEDWNQQLQQKQIEQNS